MSASAAPYLLKMAISSEYFSVVIESTQYSAGDIPKVCLLTYLGLKCAQSVEEHCTPILMGMANIM